MAKSAERGFPVVSVGLVLFVLLAGSLGWVSWRWHLQKSIAETAAWTIKGPPCPAVTAAQFRAQDMHATDAIDIGGVRMARRFGHASCNEVYGDGGRGLSTYPVCQFTSPKSLVITTKTGVYYFDPEVGPATISVEHGTPTCVRAAPDWAAALHTQAG
jgi:hypothetical protein